MTTPDPFLALRRIHLFSGLKDDQVREAAKKFKYEEHEADKIIFHQGDPGEAFYVIQSGTVAVIREKGAQPQTISKLSEGDYFGEMALIYGRRRNATVQTVTKVGLWRLDAEGFNALLRDFPQIKSNLIVTIDTRKDIQRRHFKWLEPEEFIFLIAGKHDLLFLLSIAPGILGLILGMVGAGVGYFLFHTPLALYLFLAVALISGGWLFWQYEDWDNDLYIVTNKRIVDYEKIVLIYESRNEAPLNTCRNVTVTTDQWGRMLDYGDVVVNTFSGPITFKNIPRPQAVADLIQEQLNRTRTRQAQADREALKRGLRQQMGLERPPDEKPAQTIKGGGSAPPAKQGREAAPNPLAQLRDHFTFRVRAERGSVVTYRKHPYVLLQNIWAPSLSILALCGLLGLRIAGVIILLSWPSFLVAWFIPLLALIGWWLYEYEDWRNDIYQVTPEQIIDIDKKPLGQETRKTANIANILSVKTDRPGLMALLLNYGTVIVQTGPGGEMRFHDVYNPLEVQQDIFRRMEAKQSKTAADQAAAERARLGALLGAFYEVQMDEERRRLLERRSTLQQEVSKAEAHLNELNAQIKAVDRLLSLPEELEAFDAATIAQFKLDRQRAKESIPDAWTRLQALQADLRAVEHELQLVEGFKVKW